MRKRIVVTQRDIDAGCEARRQNGLSEGGNCPVFRAAERAFPGVRGLWVTKTHITNIRNGTGIARLPDRARVAIDRFDSSGVMEPFQFTVEVQS